MTSERTKKAKFKLAPKKIRFKPQNLAMLCSILLLFHINHNQKFVKDERELELKNVVFCAVFVIFRKILSSLTPFVCILHVFRGI